MCSCPNVCALAAFRWEIGENVSQMEDQGEGVSRIRKGEANTADKPRHASLREDSAYEGAGFRAFEAFEPGWVGV